MTVRTRIAPSPTGFMHIGNLRTALYSYFLARQNGGQFLIRIEDTDRERLVEGAIEGLLKTFATLGIHHDEGPVLEVDGSLGERGVFGPYVQSQRLVTYKKYIDMLLADGHAYHCFCTPERLGVMRAEQTAVKMTPKYDRRCLMISKDAAATRVAAGEKYVVRMKMPEGTTTFVDAVRGEVTFKNADIDDQILLKSDGFPTYHLAVVVDDHLMEISHVLRGDEWISSTPKHIALYAMFGWTPPVFAHLPLLLNPDKTKLSKRKGDVSVESFLAKGYLPNALLNFIATLGFNPKSDQEIYDMHELIELFDLSKVNASGAVVNIEKLDWMNHEYLMHMDDAEYVAAAMPFCDVPAGDIVRRALLVERSRIHRLDELTAAIAPYHNPVDYRADMLVWKKSTREDATVQLHGVLAFVKTLPDSAFASVVLLEESLARYTLERALGKGNVLWPLRVALSGAERSASPFELLWALGRDESVRRLEGAVQKIGDRK